MKYTFLVKNSLPDFFGGGGVEIFIQKVWRAFSMSHVAGVWRAGQRKHVGEENTGSPLTFRWLQ